MTHEACFLIVEAKPLVPFGNAFIRVFTERFIPLPAALPLYGTGLAVMGFIGWRKKRKAVAAWHS